MAWTAPRTYATGELITATIANTHWRDNLRESGAPQAVFAREGTLAVVTGVGRYRIPEGSGITVIRGVSVACNTAPTGATLICDINLNGTTIFTTQANRPTVAISGTAATEVTNMDVTAVTSGDYLTVDIDQVGSTVAGADLTVIVRFGRE